MLRSDPAFASANGIQLCYDTFGDRANPALLLIMGLAAQMIVWDEDFCERLAAEGFWVIRFDNRDIGLSTRFPDARTPSMAQIVLAGMRRKADATYALRDMARDALGLLDALGVERAHVVGVSMGGAIGQELAIHHPERLLTLTLIMATSGDPKLPGPKPRALGALMKRAPAGRAAYLGHYIDTWRVLAGNSFPFDEQRTLRQATASFERGINPDGGARQMLAIIASGNRKPALASVTVPTLVVHGAEDPLVPVEAGIDLARTIPGAKLEIVEGMGHTLPREAWPRIITAIGGHAGKLDRARFAER